MHTLFLREHNRVAKELKEFNPTWSSDTVFDETRLIIAAMHQVITCREYLPLLLGPTYMDRYDLNWLMKVIFTDTMQQWMLLYSNPIFRHIDCLSVITNFFHQLQPCWF